MQRPVGLAIGPFGHASWNQAGAEELQDPSRQQRLWKCAGQKKRTVLEEIEPGAWSHDVAVTLSPDNFGKRQDAHCRPGLAFGETEEAGDLIERCAGMFLEEMEQTSSRAVEIAVSVCSRANLSSITFNGGGISRI